MKRDLKLTGFTAIARMTSLLCATTAVVLMGLGTASAETAPKMKMTTPIPNSIITPQSVDTRLGKLNFFDGFPDHATSEKIYDNLDSCEASTLFSMPCPAHRLKP